MAIGISDNIYSALVRVHGDDRPPGQTTKGLRICGNQRAILGGTCRGGVARGEIVGVERAPGLPDGTLAV